MSCAGLLDLEETPKPAAAIVRRSFPADVGTWLTPGDSVPGGPSRTVCAPLPERGHRPLVRTVGATPGNQPANQARSRSQSSQRGTARGTDRCVQAVPEVPGRGRWGQKGRIGRIWRGCPPAGGRAVAGLILSPRRDESSVRARLPGCGDGRSTRAPGRGGPESECAAANHGRATAFATDGMAAGPPYVGG